MTQLGHQAHADADAEAERQKAALEGSNNIATSNNNNNYDVYMNRYVHVRKIPLYTMEMQSFCLTRNTHLTIMHAHACTQHHHQTQNTFNYLEYFNSTASISQVIITHCLMNLQHDNMCIIYIYTRHLVLCTMNK